MKTTPTSLKGGMCMGIVYRKEPSNMQEIIQISSQVIIAISAAVQMVVKLIEFFEHKKSNPSAQG